MDDERINALRKGMRSKHYELSSKDLSTNEYFQEMAEEVVRILENYYGSARYWMAARFERELVLSEIQEKIDEIRDANLST